MSDALGREGSVRSTRYAAEARRVRLVLLRNVLLAMVIVAILGVALEGLISPPDPRGQRPSTFSTRADGFRGLHDVAEHRGYAVARQLDSYGALPDPATHTLVVIDPLPTALLLGQGVDMGPAQVRALTSWVEAGGQLVVALPGRSRVQVLSAEVDTDLDLASDADLLPALLGATPPCAWVDLGGLVKGRGPLSGRDHGWPVLAHDDAVRVSAYLRRGGEDGETLVRFVEDDAPLQLVAFDAEQPVEGYDSVFELEGAPLVLTKARGRGKIWLTSSSYPFTNMGLARGHTDHFADALLFAASDGGQRTVVFDEYSHGLWNRQGATAILTASGLHVPALAVVLLAVVVGWRGSVRLAAAKPPATVARRAKEEFVISLADLAERAGRHRAAARWLHDAHDRDLPTGPDARLRLVRELQRAGFGRAELVAFAATLRDAVRASTKGNA